jgi:transcriptional regulator with XRE-family HTH domain
MNFMNISIGSTLAKLRRDKKYMQKDVAAKLSGYGFSVNAKTIYNWEKGLSQPSIPHFLALCDIFGVDDALWQFAGIHKGPYAGLNQAGRQKAREFIDLLFYIDMYRDDPEEHSDSPRLLRLYDIPVSAGSGIFLDDSGYEMIEVPDYVPAAADFALRVSGDSMEPLFQDGQVIWIKEQEVLSYGEIGIFIYFDDVYLKKLIINSGKAYLRSLNPKYNDIEIKEDFGFKTIGKIVS